MKETFGKKRTSVVFWSLFSLFFGGILWLVKEPLLAFVVAGVVFGAGVFVAGQERTGESVREEAEKAWGGVIRKLLGEEKEVRILAFLDGPEPMIPYREYIAPSRILQRNGREMLRTGLHEAFCGYFFLRCLSSCDLRMVDVMMEKEAQKWQRLWWREWKEAWWSEVPSHLRKVLVDRFEAK